MKVAVWIATVAEMFPMVGLLPTWGLCVAYAYVKEKQYINDYQEKIKKFEEQINKM